MNYIIDLIPPLFIVIMLYRLIEKKDLKEKEKASYYFLIFLFLVLITWN